MKKILLVIGLLVIAGIAIAAYQITLTDLKVENFVIYRQDVTDEEGVVTQEIFLALNSILYNANGDREGKNKIFDLTTEQKTAIVIFIKLFVQEAAAEYDVNPPAWAQ